MSDDRFEFARQISASLMMSRLPARGGKRFEEAFRHGTLQIVVFAPRGRDTQRPSARDELHVVIRGSGFYVNGSQRFAFGPGDVLFAAAGEVHRFEGFGEDFFAWVISYGPDGGEQRAAASAEVPAPPATAGDSEPRRRRALPASEVPQRRGRATQLRSEVP